MEKLDAKQCYVTLGLEPGATQEQIKNTYRELVRQWHPDKVAHNPKLQAIAQEELQAINASYEFLKTYTFSKNTYYSEPEQPSQSKKDQQRAEAEQQEKRERESNRRERETERLHMQQEAEATYHREELAKAKEEANKKQEEAKQLRAQVEAASKLALQYYSEYEAVYIVAPYLTAPQIALITEKYKKIIEMGRGIVKKIDIWERRKLRYEIEGYDEGIYVIMGFSSSPRTESELRRAFQAGEDHIRFW